MRIRQFFREKFKVCFYGYIIIPSLGGGGPAPAPTQWITYQGAVNCEPNPWINFQAFEVQLYVGKIIDSSVEIDDYGTFRKEKFETRVGPKIFKLVVKSTGQVVDEVKFEANNKESYMVVLNACRDLKN